MLKRWSLALLLLPCTALGQTPCSRLAAITLSHTAVSRAQSVDAGALRLIDSSDSAFASGAAFHDLPPFCRIVLALSPAPDSAIKVELWMPARQWNGRFLGVGNGGFAGSIDYASLATALRQGYATAATDTGHSGSFTDAHWALGHPEKIVDFAYRAIHLMTVESKAVLRLYYGRPPSYAYFESCSTGGRQGLMEAQRFPKDYSGILAGAPANNWTSLLASFAYVSRALNLDPASYIPADRLPAIRSAVLAACDGQDGIRDGVINFPPSCRFDPSVLLCKGESSAACLTQRQITALNAIYSGMQDANGRKIFPGFEPGGELGSDGWGPWILGDAPRESLLYEFGTRYFANMVYDDPHWNLDSFNVDQSLANARRRDGALIDATNPDLHSFARSGGKLILYHGWSDAAIPPRSTIDYDTAVRSTLGSPISDAFLRLYMVPGMQHCQDGPGPSSFGQNGPSSASGPMNPQHDIRLALEAWVEKGDAPGILTGAHYEGRGTDAKIVFTRPLCPYPAIAVYNGHGPADAASSFSCIDPSR